MKRKVQAQRKFAAGAYIPPSASSSERRTEGVPKEDNKNVVVFNNKMCVVTLLDIIAFQNLHKKPREPVVVLERINDIRKVPVGGRKRRMASPPASEQTDEDDRPLQFIAQTLRRKSPKRLRKRRGSKGRGGSLRAPTPASSGLARLRRSIRRSERHQTASGVGGGMTRRLVHRRVSAASSVASLLPRRRVLAKRLPGKRPHASGNTQQRAKPTEQAAVPARAQTPPTAVATPSPPITRKRGSKMVSGSPPPSPTRKRVDSAPARSPPATTTPETSDDTANAPDSPTPAPAVAKRASTSTPKKGSVQKQKKARGLLDPLQCKTRKRAMVEDWLKEVTVRPPEEAEDSNFKVPRVPSRRVPQRHPPRATDKESSTPPNPVEATLPTEEPQLETAALQTVSSVLPPEAPQPPSTPKEVSGVKKPLAPTKPSPKKTSTKTKTTHLQQPTSAHLPQPSSANVPQPTTAHLPQPSSANVPQPTTAHLPQPMSAHLPQPSSAKLPQPISANLPQPTSANLPQPTSAHLPQPISAHLPQQISTESQQTSSHLPHVKGSTEVVEPRCSEGRCPSRAGEAGRGGACCAHCAFSQHAESRSARVASAPPRVERPPEDVYEFRADADEPAAPSLRPPRARAPPPPDAPLPPGLYPRYLGVFPHDKRLVVEVSPIEKQGKQIMTARLIPRTAANVVGELPVIEHDNLLKWFTHLMESGKFPSVEPSTKSDSAAAPPAATANTAPAAMQSSDAPRNVADASSQVCVTDVLPKNEDQEIVDLTTDADDVKEEVVEVSLDSEAHTNDKIFQNITTDDLGQIIDEELTDEVCRLLFSSRSSSVVPGRSSTTPSEHSVGPGQLDKNVQTNSQVTVLDGAEVRQSLQTEVRRQSGAEAPPPQTHPEPEHPAQPARAERKSSQPKTKPQEEPRPTKSRMTTRRSGVSSPVPTRLRGSSPNVPKKVSRQTSKKGRDTSPRLRSDAPPPRKKGEGPPTKKSTKKAEAAAPPPDPSIYLCDRSEDCFQEAPVFYPSEEEFLDPLAFFGKISVMASKYGICKVVAPHDFKPSCTLAEDVRFNVANQYLSRLFCRWGAASREMCAIKAYLAEQKVFFMRPPLIDGIELNLPKLYRTVQQHGGLKEVIEKKRWARVAEDMRFPRGPRTAQRIDQLYVKHLLPYDTLSSEERCALLATVEKSWSRNYTRMVRRALNPLHRQKRLLEESESSDDAEEDADAHLAGALAEAEDCVVAGRHMKLSVFKKVADNVMGALFDKIDPTPEEVEQRYWELVGGAAEHVCVNTASIDTGEGYGFPRAQSDAYHKHPWNLKMLSQNSANVLRSLGAVLGVTVPTLHLGMVLATSCWHRDPHGLPWVEYLHQGPAKIWYGIPAELSSEFREAVETLCPTACQNKSIWLPSDITMIPPRLLAERSVRLSRVVQRPGEFIVVLPKAYSSSISTGYTQSESVYFATRSWLEDVAEVFQELRDSCEPTMFSLEQLLLAVAQDPRAAPDVLQGVLPALAALAADERRHRATLRDMGVEFQAPEEPRATCNRQKKKPAGAWNVREQDECEICRTTLYLSKVTGLTDKRSSLCLQHAIRVLERRGARAHDDVHATAFILHAELEETLMHVRARLASAHTQQDAPTS